MSKRKTAEGAEEIYEMKGAVTGSDRERGDRFTHFRVEKT